MIEAMACGVPVAAYPVPGPIDVVGAGGLGPMGTLAEPVGALDEDLTLAITHALGCSREAAAAHGGSYSWDSATDQFITALSNAARSRSARSHPVRAAA
jgi:glycosyltransferase involved in cell wall biosynthesis